VKDQDKCSIIMVKFERGGSGCLSQRASCSAWERLLQKQKACAAARDAAEMRKAAEEEAEKKQKQAVKAYNAKLETKKEKAHELERAAAAEQTKALTDPPRTDTDTDTSADRTTPAGCTGDEPSGAWRKKDKDPGARVKAWLDTALGSSALVNLQESEHVAVLKVERRKKAYDKHMQAASRASNVRELVKETGGGYTGEEKRNCQEKLPRESEEKLPREREIANRRAPHLAPVEINRARHLASLEINSPNKQKGTLESTQPRDSFQNGIWIPLASTPTDAVRRCSLSSQMMKVSFGGDSEHWPTDALGWGPKERELEREREHARERARERARARALEREREREREREKGEVHRYTYIYHHLDLCAEKLTDTYMGQCEEEASIHWHPSAQAASACEGKHQFKILSADTLFSTNSTTNSVPPSSPTPQDQFKMAAGRGERVDKVTPRRSPRSPRSSRSHLSLPPPLPPSQRSLLALLALLSLLTLLALLSLLALLAALLALLALLPAHDCSLWWGQTASSSPTLLLYTRPSRSFNTAGKEEDSLILLRCPTAEAEWSASRSVYIW
jgi:hypothetical protein